MEKRFVYADNAATTPLSEIAFNAMKPWLTEHYGNPSSLYRMGREAKEAINEARRVVAKCLNAAMPVNEKNDYAPGEILFTGGAIPAAGIQEIRHTLVSGAVCASGIPLGHFLISPCNYSFTQPGKTAFGYPHKGVAVQLS